MTLQFRSRRSGPGSGGAKRRKAELRLQAEPVKKGSSRNTGKCGADAQEEVGIVAVAVGHALEDFDLVVDPLDESRVQRIPAVGDDTRHVRRKQLCKAHQRSDPARQRTPVPGVPEAFGRLGIATPPDLLQVILEYVDD